MAQLSKGKTFSSGDSVTASDLNNLVDDATIVDLAVVTAKLAANSVTEAKLGTDVDSDSLNFLQAGAGAAARTIQATLRDTVSVKDFGATGDGVADDTAEVQAAIDAIPAGGVLFFPAGTYLITDTLDLKSNITLDGGGGAQINATGDDHLFDATGTDASTRLENITIRNFKATATSIGTGGQHFFFSRYVRNILIQGCRIEDFAGAGIKFDSATSVATALGNFIKNAGIIGIYAEGDPTEGVVDSIFYIDNYIEDFQYGLEVKQGTDIVIIGNRVEQADSSTAKGYGIVLARNGPSTGADEFVIQRATITGNTVKNASYGIVCSQAVDCVVADNVIKDTGAYGTDTGSAIAVSGSTNSVTGNLVDGVTGGGSGISVEYESNITSGSGGVAATYDAANSVVSNNVVRSVNNISMLFTELSKSIVSNNIVTKQLSANYGVKFDNCDETIITGNTVNDGTFTYGYRFETTSSDVVFQNNTSIGHTSGAVSRPSAYSNTITAMTSGRDYVLETQQAVTTDDTQTAIWSLTTSTYEAYLVEVDVVCRNNSYEGGFRKIALVYRRGSGPAMRGSVASVFDEDNDSGNLDATIAVNSNDIEVQVTGVAAQTINWIANIKYTVAIA